MTWSVCFRKCIHKILFIRITKVRNFLYIFLDIQLLISFVLINIAIKYIPRTAAQLFVSYVWKITKISVFHMWHCMFSMIAISSYVHCCQMPNTWVTEDGRSCAKNTHKNSNTLLTSEWYMYDSLYYFRFCWSPGIFIHNSLWSLHRMVQKNKHKSILKMQNVFVKSLNMDTQYMDKYGKIRYYSTVVLHETFFRMWRKHTQGHLMGKKHRTWRNRK